MSNSCRVSPPGRHRKGQQGPIKKHQEKKNCQSAAPSNKSTLATLSQGTSTSSRRQSQGYALLRKTNQGARSRKGQSALNWMQSLWSLCHGYASNSCQVWEEKQGQASNILPQAHKAQQLHEFSSTCPTRFHCFVLCCCSHWRATIQIHSLEVSVSSHRVATDFHSSFPSSFI